MTREDVRPANDILERLGLTSLAYAPFRVYLSANLVSNASWFVFSAGLGWFVLDVTKSAAAVGFAAFVNGLPWALFMLHAGLLTDRFGAKPLVAISLAAGGLAMFAMGILALWETPLWIILVLAFVMGLVQTLGGPGFISIVNDLVPPKAVSSAVVMTFFGFNVGRITGGIAAGVLLGLHSDPRIAAAFTIIAAGICQAAPSIPISRIRTPNQASRSTSVALVRPLVEAGSYAVRHRTLGVILIMSVVPGALGLSYSFMLPVAVGELGSGPEGLGWLFAGGGVGGLLAGVVGEPIMRRLGHGRAIFAGLAASASGLLIVGIVGWLPVAVAGVGLAQAGFVVYASASLALVQALSPANLRGRLTALFTLLYWGLMPIGGLLNGAVAEASSARFAFALAGTAMLACGAFALVARRQVSTLWIERDGHSMRGDLAGSGYEARGFGEAAGHLRPTRAEDD